MKSGDLVVIRGTTKKGLVLSVEEHAGGRHVCEIWWAHSQRKGRTWMHALELCTPQGSGGKKISELR